MLNKSLFGQPRPILDYLPSYLYLFQEESNTYATLDTVATRTRINGYAGPWQTPAELKPINQEFLKNHDYIESDRLLLKGLTIQGINDFYQKMSAEPHLEPDYQDMMDQCIIQVNLEENKISKKRGTARGLCSTLISVLGSTIFNFSQILYFQKQEEFFQHQEHIKRSKYQ